MLKFCSNPNCCCVLVQFWSSNFLSCLFFLRAQNEKERKRKRSEKKRQPSNEHIENVKNRLIICSLIMGFITYERRNDKNTDSDSDETPNGSHSRRPGSAVMFKNKLILKAKLSCVPFLAFSPAVPFRLQRSSRSSSLREGERVPHKTSQIYNKKR